MFDVYIAEKGVKVPRELVGDVDSFIECWATAGESVGKADGEDVWHVVLAIRRMPAYSEVDAFTIRGLVIVENPTVDDEGNVWGSSASVAYSVHLLPRFGIISALVVGRVTSIEDIIAIPIMEELGKADALRIYRRITRSA